MPRRGFALRRLLFPGSKRNRIRYDCYTTSDRSSRPRFLLVMVGLQRGRRFRFGVGFGATGPVNGTGVMRQLDAEQPNFRMASQHPAPRPPMPRTSGADCHVRLRHEDALPS
jgi:hypothetical protein